MWNQRTSALDRMHQFADLPGSAMSRHSNYPDSFFKTGPSRRGRRAIGGSTLELYRKSTGTVRPLGKFQKFGLAREGVQYDMIAHERTRDSNHSAQAAHIPGNRLAKCVMLEDDKGYLMAVVPATHKVDLGAVHRQLGRELGLATGTRSLAPSSHRCCMCFIPRKRTVCLAQCSTLPRPPSILTLRSGARTG